MANMLFANNCNTTLSSNITNVATTLSVTSATGFPSPAGSQYFYCTLADAATQTTIEIVKVTAVSGTTFTIVRGQDGTSGTAFASGAVVSLRLVSANLNDFPKLDEANTFTFAPTFNTALAVGSGGTGVTTLTAGYIPYGNGASAFSSSSALTFNGTILGVTGYTSIKQTSDYSSAGSGINFIKSNTTDVWTAYVGADTAFGIAYGATLGASNRLLSVFPTGGVSIGNTTDPGATNLSVTGVIKIGANQAVNGPAFSAYQSSAQTISTGTVTKIQFQSEEFDTNNNFDSATNYRFTPTVAGYYQVSLGVQTATVQTRMIPLIYKNGVNFKSPVDVSALVYGVFIGGLIYFNGSTDYIEGYIYLGTGANLTNDAAKTYFQAAMMRGA